MLGSQANTLTKQNFLLFQKQEKQIGLLILFPADIQTTQNDGTYMGRKVQGR